MVPSLGGGAMNLASLLGGVGLQTLNPLNGVLGGSTTGLLCTAGVPNEVAGGENRGDGDLTSRSVYSQSAHEANEC